MFSIDDAQVISDRVLRDQIERHPRAQELLRAFLYPYDAPDQDFLFSAGQIKSLGTDEVLSQTIGRVPVLAVGSNRAPVQLTRKFSHQNISDTIPVTLGWMMHHDIVYSTHISGYGAVPATLAPSPGTRVRIAVTWLDAGQLAHMHVTESVPVQYQYVGLHGRDIELDCGHVVDNVGLYQSSSGYLFGRENTFALSAIRAENRRYQALSQWDIMAHIARAKGQVLRPEFVLRLIDDQDFRNAVNGCIVTR
ncbi:hypothetical protein [Thalassospira aquimaris]|uniref:Hedgehog/Intein (Hint) domain-containing protein n=1 Tax=Thalassospira aquimaris TaxID=3037796 RepID=A0ABT6G8P2_9PROT|nr:hypothetical protein [Thalassospira sp. FZY0004]MDG4718432.1 hypothetical protein [Thalassospira sp. FZY0004]